MVTSAVIGMRPSGGIEANIVVTGLSLEEKVIEDETGKSREAYLVSVGAEIENTGQTEFRTWGYEPEFLIGALETGATEIDPIGYICMHGIRDIPLAPGDSGIIRGSMYFEPGGELSEFTLFTELALKPSLLKRAAERFAWNRSLPLNMRQWLANYVEVEAHKFSSETFIPGEWAGSTVASHPADGF